MDVPNGVDNSYTYDTGMSVNPPNSFFDEAFAAESPLEFEDQPPRVSLETTSSEDSSLRYSSDASHGPKRKLSSRSSHSPDIKKEMNDMVPLKHPGGRVLHPKDVNSHYTMLDGGAEDIESSNRVMEDSFDFAVASHCPSPDPNANTAKATGLGDRFYTMPQNSPGATSVTMGADSPLSIDTIMKFPEDSPPADLFNGPYSSVDPIAPKHQTNSDRVNSRAASNGRQPPLQISRTVPIPIANFNPVVKSPMSPSPSDSEDLDKILAEIDMPSRLFVYLTHIKTRVETQFYSRLGLLPFPAGIKQLHLPSHAISKPKQLAKRPAAMSATLELSTMVVCTSAMRNPEKLRNALAIARNNPGQAAGEEPPKGSPFAGAAPTPAEGGPVAICKQCAEREIKRAARKKTKNSEEEGQWSKDVAKRILFFNTNEYQDWCESPGEAQCTKITTEKPAAAKAELAPPPQPLPVEARQVELPARIACYCRHCNEKEGFRVIFTIKDCNGKLVGQGISNSILLTDDHKSPNSQPPPRVTPRTFEQSYAIHDGRFSSAQPFANGPSGLTHAKAFSSTDLQRLGDKQVEAAHYAAVPYAVPQGLAQQPVASTMPHTLARQPSSSLQGQPTKRRKASGGSGTNRVPEHLQITSLQPGNVPTGAVQQRSSLSPTSAASFWPVRQQYGSARHAAHASTQWTTNPPSPENEPSFDHTIGRSYSFGSGSQARSAVSLPSSARQSRSNSPVMVSPSSQYSNPTDQHMFAANVLSQGSSLDRPAPVILKTGPAEGPTSGSIEILIVGKNFHPDLKVFFGACEATRVCVLGTESLTCCLPPALQPGLVEVMLQNPWHMMNHFQPPPPNIAPVYFRYKDLSHDQLVKHTLDMLNKKLGPDGQSLENFMYHIQHMYAASSGLQGVDNQVGQEMYHEMHRENSARHAVEDVELESKIVNLIKLLDLEANARRVDIDFRQKNNGQSLLHLAASVGFLRLVDGLLTRGANPNLPDRGSHTPLHMAALNGHAAVVRMLRGAGADLRIRSLRGFTPTDMATNEEVYDALLVDLWPRSRSRRRTPWTRYRTGSRSSTISQREASISTYDMYHEYSDGDDEASYSTHDSRFSTPVHASARSRRNSTAVGPELISPPDTYPGSLIAWRDSLALQIQHFQQNVSRTFPTLQLPNLPNLPAMPNLPTLPESYQAGFMMRRLSPFMNRSNASDDEADRSDSKESESTLPAYEELFPNRLALNEDTKLASAKQAAVDTLADQKCNTLYDEPATAVASKSATTSQTIDGTLTIGKGEATLEELQKLRAAHAQRMKGLKNDVKLYAVWIPILVFVVFTVMWNKAPHAIQVTKDVYEFMTGRTPVEPMVCHGSDCVIELR